MKKSIIIYTLCLSVALFAACANDDQYDMDYFTNTFGSSSADSSADDSEQTVAEGDTVKIAIDYSGTSASVSGTATGVSVNVSDAHVTVTSTTSKYLQLTLSGTTSNGQLLVYGQSRYGIVLSGANITCLDGPAINNQCSKALDISCADGTTNSLTDGIAYTEQQYDQKGTLFSEGQIYFLGIGTLTVNGNAKNGIASDDYIIFQSGTVNVNVAATGSNGVKVNDGFTISGGTLAIDVKADGARGINSDARTTISGGTTTITTSGDCKIATVDGVQDTTSAAGIKSDSLVAVTAGTLVITSSGDGGKGINCSENVEISGGTLTITTTGSNDIGKPKGIKSDTAIIVSGGSTDVTVSKSWALDNGSESDDPADHVTIKGSPATLSLAKKAATIKY